MTENEAHIEEYEKNQRCFIQNFEDIPKNTGIGSFAVWNPKVIGSDADLTLLSVKVRKKKMNAKCMYAGIGYRQADRGYSDQRTFHYNS